MITRKPPLLTFLLATLSILAVIVLIPSEVLAQGGAAPTHADILRGEYGRYRANNDLLYYHLDVRVDPNRKYLSWQHSDSFQDAEGRQSYPTGSPRGSESRQDRVFRKFKVQEPKPADRTTQIHA